MRLTIEQLQYLVQTYGPLPDDPHEFELELKRRVFKEARKERREREKRNGT